MNKIVGIGAAALVLSSVLGETGVAGRGDTAAVTTFVSPFNGTPPGPKVFESDRWDVTVHSRDRLGGTLDPMHAGHGSNCSAPPATHRVSGFRRSVFQCNDHVMTAINAEGYGLIYLTPNHMVDFADREAVISIDVSTQLLSTRDWWDIWVTPFDDHLQLAGEDWYPDLQGAPRRAIHIRMETFDNGGAGFSGELFENFRPRRLRGNPSIPLSSVLTPSATRRDTFQLRISRGRIRFGMPDYGLWWVDAQIPALEWGRGVVQLGHHSYNPTKDDKLPNARANTWHWDNMRISPATPFRIIHSDQRAVSRSTTTIGFDRPAPAGSRLRFAGFGTNLQISVNGGRTWSRAVKQPHGRAFTPYTFASYFTPVPAGTRNVRIRGSAVAGTGWTVRDISIWSRHLS